jgi:hypothetical protein
MQSDRYTYYRRLAVQVKDAYRPPLALKALERMEKDVGEDSTVVLEDKIELYKLFDILRGKLEGKTWESKPVN